VTRDAFRREFSLPRRTAALIVSLGVGALVIQGRWPYALALIAAVVLWVPAHARLSRLRYPVRTGTLREIALLPWSCDIVWDLIEPAEKAPLLEPSYVRGYRVPGTPDGVGCRQAFELADGSTSVIEVSEYQPGRFATTRQVSPPSAEPRRTTQSVEPVDDGCKYTMTLELDVKLGLRILPAFEKQWRAFAADHFARVRKVLTESEAADSDRPPTQPPTRWAPPPPA
jgi:Polyketide cyclase / dehydrase and lipid transport